MHKSPDFHASSVYSLMYMACYVATKRQVKLNTWNLMNIPSFQQQKKEKKKKKPHKLSPVDRQ